MKNIVMLLFMPLVLVLTDVGSAVANVNDDVKLECSHFSLSTASLNVEEVQLFYPTLHQIDIAIVQTSSLSINSLVVDKVSLPFQNKKQVYERIKIPALTVSKIYPTVNTLFNGVTYRRKIQYATNENSFNQDMRRMFNYRSGSNRWSDHNFTQYYSISRGYPPIRKV